MGSWRKRDDRAGGTPRARPVLVILADYFEPAFEAGGVVRALASSLGLLGKQFDQFIVTRDHDLFSRRPFAFLASRESRRWTEQWTPTERGQVWYAPSTIAALVRIPLLVRRLRPDAVYLNSVFSLFSITALLDWFTLPRRPMAIVLAPRGEFAPAALSIKVARKRAWIRLLRGVHRVREIYWLASSEKERDEILQVLPGVADPRRITVVPEIVAVPPAAAREHEKEAGTLRVCILGRIAPIKNIDGAIRALLQARGSYVVDAIGPADDPLYLRECESLLAQHARNVEWRWRGALPHEEALAHLGQSDVLLAPSHSENFGHAIAEALSLGIPVIVSSGTPWSEVVGAGAGWSVLATSEDELRSALEAACALDQEGFAELAGNTLRLAKERLQTSQSADALVDLFTRAAAASFDRAEGDRE